MKTIIKILCFAILPFWASAQHATNFKVEFEAALKHKITNQIADSLVARNYSSLIWFYDGSPDVKAYPLKEMLKERLYQDNIGKLFADTAQKVNILACLMAVSTKDTTKIQEVKNVLIGSNYKNMIVAKCLLILDPKALIPIAKCIKAYDFDETVQYLMIDFLYIEQPILEKFAQDSIFCSDLAMQYLSIKAMGVIKPNETNEKLLRQAVVKYDTLMKGWPLAALAQYKGSNIYELVKPYLNYSQLREVSLRALAASNDVADKKQLLKLADTNEPNKDLLEVLLNAGKDDYVKKWLYLFEKGVFPDGYYFTYHNDLNRLDYLQTISSIIEMNKNRMQVYSLMQYFEHVKNEQTKAFLEKCLNHSSEDIRKRATELLK